jgi:hypothetical protein
LKIIIIHVNCLGWHLLLPSSILDIYKVFKHIDMLSISIQQHPYTVLLALLGSYFGVWVTCGVKMMSLRQGWGWQPLQTASLIHTTHIQSVWAHCHWYAVHPHITSSLIQIPILLGSDVGVLGHLWSQNDVIMSRLRLTATSNCLPHPYYTYTKCLSILICYPSAYNISLTQFYSP